jgi:hypothetical protein
MSVIINPKLAEGSAEAVCAEMPPASVSFREAFWLWVKVALNSFGGRYWPDAFATARAKDAKADECNEPAVDALLNGGQAAHIEPTLARFFKVLIIWSALWFGPIIDPMLALFRFKMKAISTILDGVATNGKC